MEELKDEEKIYHTLLVECVFKSLIIKGDLNVKGKTTKEAGILFLNWIEKNMINKSEGIKTLSVEDHKNDLLEEAIKYRESDKHLLSCLMFATWIEHWLNGLIKDLTLRHGFESEDSSQIIRDSNIRSKFGWLLKMFSMPEFDIKYKNKALQIIEYRNGFVHYKYKGTQQLKADKKLLKLLSDLENTCTYFTDYYNKNILYGHSSLPFVNHTELTSVNSNLKMIVNLAN